MILSLLISKFMLVSIIVYIALLISTGAEAHKNGRRRHFRRQIKENDNKANDVKKDLCQEPEDLKNQMLGWWNENDVYYDTEYSTDNDEKKNYAKGLDYIEYNPNSNDFGANVQHKICEQPPEKTVHSSIMQRSLCPWQWRSNYDEKREPKFISEAVCLCRKSRGLSGSFCMPIKRKFSVLKRVACNPITKRYEYVKEIEEITVGCHSVLPRSQGALPISAFYSDKRHEIEVK